MGFNKFQQEAIDAPSTLNVLVSAGAGSGKTKTLAERVFTLVDKGEVAPESLLVLTFTNNAAHEMKTRILARFPSSHPAASRMLSCHVQSFDSFNAYLVRCYASRLGVAPGIEILSSSLYEQKKRLYLDEVFLEACQDPLLKQDLVRLMGELGLKDERLIKGTALDLIKTAEKLPPNERARFFENACSHFLSPSFAQELFQQCLEEYKKQLRQILRETYLIDLCRENIANPEKEEIDVDSLALVLRNDAYYSVPLNQIRLSEDETQAVDFLDDEFHALLDLLDRDGEDFVSAASEFLQAHEADYYQTNYPGSKARKVITDAHYHAPVFASLKRTKAILDEVVSLGSEQEQWEKMTRFDYAVALFVGLARKTLDRLQDYEKRHNAYTFSDVTALALSLFTDPKNEDIAEALRKRFAYVMVDEYQDTNDAQEVFIEGLLKPTKQGTRAHLFCVGDAKQSIYAFRGSNVALFRHRQADYERCKDGQAKVIPMAINYRSAKTLLNQINYLFSRYMRLDHGGIAYTDPIEMLGYDNGVNLYYKELPLYGVHRIVPPMSHFFTSDARKAIPYDDVTYEVKAILSDIQNKLESGFLVFDREIKGTRPCRKNDFCILLRRKRSVPVYQRLFAENGIALNNRVSVDLRDASAIAFIQSLLRLLCFALGENIDDLAHCFASVARSYAFRYDDNRLHQILSANNTYDLEEAKEQILSDPLMKEVFAFARDYEHESFPIIFLGLLSRFGVIDNLYRIGAVEDNYAKIESIYALAIAQGGVGEGLKEFVALFADLNKRQLSMDSESVFETADAVDLMTIHASKGLERKIVYLPSSDNGLGSGGNNIDTLASFIHKDYGLVLPDAGTPYLDPETDAPIRVTTLPMRLRSLLPHDEEEQENVRLLYVALTRAENALYLVGRDKGKNSSVYLMMDDVPSFVQINPILLQNPNISAAMKAKYEAYIQRRLTEKAPSSLSPEDAKTQKGLYRAYVESKVNEADDAFLAELLDAPLLDYCRRFASLVENDDELAKLYALTFYPGLYPITKQGGAKALFAALCQKEDPIDEDEENEEQGKAEEFSAYEDFLERLRRFGQGVQDKDLSSLCPRIHLSKEHLKDELYVKKTLIDVLLLPLAQYFDGLDYVYRISYRNMNGPNPYPDDVTVFSESSFQGNVSIREPKLLTPSTDDTELVFATLGEQRASKVASDEELPSPEALERGTRLHRYMQLLNFESLDFSFIPEKERPIIENVLRTPLMQEALSATSRYPEYDFYDPESLHMGSIDLLYVKDGIYHIVDYKTTSIDDPAYDRQVRVYARNVMRLFGVEKENIRLHLLSLRLGTSRDVSLDEKTDSH